jgi:hypothetical protein
MKPETLAYIKKELTKFLKVVEALSYYWKDIPHYTLLYVLVQNMTLDKVNTVGYDHNKEVEKLHTIMSILDKIKDYHNSHFEKYIHRECDFIISGNIYSEDFDFE